MTKVCKSILFFRDVFSYFSYFIYFGICIYIMFLYVHMVGRCWGPLMSTSLKCQFKEVDYETHFEGDPIISKIRNVPLQNIQRVGPHPKSL